MTAGSDSTHSAKDHQDPGMIPSFRVWSTPDELAREGAILFRELLKKDVLSRNTSAVVLSGGKFSARAFWRNGKVALRWLRRLDWKG